jgi:hypothetical protein
LVYNPTNSPGYLKPSRNHDTQDSTNPCSTGGTTFEEPFIFTTTTPDQDEEETKKPVQKCTKMKIGGGSEEMQRDGQTD